jgi:hypothetical protein
MSTVRFSQPVPISSRGPRAGLQHTWEPSPALETKSRRVRRRTGSSPLALVLGTDLSHDVLVPRAPPVAGKEVAAHLPRMLLDIGGFGVAHLSGKFRKRDCPWPIVKTPLAVIRRCGGFDDPADMGTAIRWHLNDGDCLIDKPWVSQRKYEVIARIAIRHQEISGAVLRASSCQGSLHFYPFAFRLIQERCLLNIRRIRC